jgi:flagellar hook-associated protein 3 FlgL
VESSLTHLIALRDSLLADSTRGITFAGDALKKDEGVVIQARGDVAVRAQRADMLKARSEAEDITEKSALSLLVDVDMAEALTTFSALQTQMQASLQTGAQMMQRTLMDFLA